MTRFISTISVLALTAAAAHAQAPGYQDLEIYAPHHDQMVRGGIWYPTDQDQTPIRIAENPVFHGTEVQQDAPIRAGEHPLVLMSHGMGGAAESLAWLSADLAEAGAIVVAVSHPNSTWQQFDPMAALQHWTRAQDLSLALDFVADLEGFGPFIDADRIMAAGFSYGGWTALSLGGATSSKAELTQTCETYLGQMNFCDLILAGLPEISTADWEGSYADPRVSSVVAIDPGLVWGAQVDQIIDDVTLIGFGDEDLRMIGLDFDASGLSAALPAATSLVIPDAVHFSAMPLCTPAGEAILREEGDDPVCTDPPGRGRAAIHALIGTEMLRVLEL